MCESILVSRRNRCLRSSKECKQARRSYRKTIHGEIVFDAGTSDCIPVPIQNGTGVSES
jgi:hypothetical protein